MSDSSPTPDSPQGSNNGPFLVVAALLALALVGLLVAKFKGSDETAKPTTTDATPSASVTAKAKPALTDSIPPPPDEEKPEDKPDGGAPTKKTAGGGGPCGGTCAGSLSSATSGDLRGRSAVARGCYERALRTNSMLQGKMTVNVTVDPSGNICAASVSGDTLGAPDVTACVLSAFRGQRVAPPTGGCANSTMTLNFQSKNK